MLKICIWMNIPSHYQSAFFQALAMRADVDLQVRYLNGISQDRAEEGWNNHHDCKEYEQFVSPNVPPLEWAETLGRWEDYIHITSTRFNKGLIDLFCNHRVAWCHWSEMPGVRLADCLNYNMPLYRLLSVFMLRIKYRDGHRISKFSLGAFGQGVLARRSFRAMGVPYSKTADLFYTPGPLPEASASLQVQEFARGRRVFLAVGALCKRKGIDLLLKAFAQLDTEEWCLVLCGLDKEGGTYQELSSALNIDDRVLFLGAYPSERISEVYHAADVFVLASRFDGWGAVLNEAASVGIPLVATDLCGGAWHLISEGENGFRVKAGAVGALRKALAYYVNNSTILAVHGAESRRIFLSEFTPEKNAEQLVSTLTQWVQQ